MPTAEAFDPVVMKARDNIAIARVRNERMFGYLSGAIFDLKPFPMPGIGTMGVDAKCRMAFDPVTIAAWPIEVVSFAVFHEVLHNVLDHHGRKGLRDNKIWNFAADCECNRTAAAAGIMPKVQGIEFITSQGLQLPDNLTAEEYYDILFKRASEQPQHGKQGQPEPSESSDGAGKGGGSPTPSSDDSSASEGAGHGIPGDGSPCGGCAGNPQPWEANLPDDAPDGTTDGEKTITRQSIARQIQDKRPGTVPGDLKKWADTILTPKKIPWQQILGRTLRQSIAASFGADDFTFSRLSRASVVMGAFIPNAPVLPGLHSPKPDVAAVMDTSGSMDGEPIQEAMVQIVDIAKSTGCPVKVYATDVIVHKVGSVMRHKDLQDLYVGNGGTDMRAGISEAAKRKPGVIVVVTDGYTPWPSQDEMPRGTRVIVAVVGGGNPYVPDHVGKVVNCHD